MFEKLNLSKIDRQMPVAVTLMIILFLMFVMGVYTNQDPILVNVALVIPTVFLAPLIIEILYLSTTYSIRKKILIYSGYVIMIGIGLMIQSFGNMTYSCTEDTNYLPCKASKFGFLVIYLFVSLCIGALKFESLKEQNDLKEKNEKDQKENVILKASNEKLQKELDLERNKVYPITIEFLKIFKITLNKK